MYAVTQTRTGDKSMTSLLDAYISQLRGNKHTRDQNISIVKRFLEMTGKRGREGWMEVEKKLRKQGYADSTVKNWFDAVKGLHKANNLPWEFAHSEIPYIRESDVYAPAVDPAVIEEMIGAARGGKLSDREGAFLAVSTIYGTRPVEMLKIGNEDIDLQKGTIFVRTAKRGRERLQLLPEAIVPYLERWDFDKTMCYHSLRDVYLRIEARIGFGHQDRMGWHAVRHALDTVLVDRLGEVPTAKFMRWKPKGMTGRYYAVRFVGRGGQSMSMGTDDISGDRKVFEVHPFLAMWEK
jgi:integrase